MQMAMSEAAGLVGRGLHDRTGATMGTIDDVIAGADTHHAVWLSVRDDAGKRAVVPLIDLVIDEHVRVPYTAHQILGAPAVADSGLTPHLDRELRLWYGMPAVAEPDDPGAGRHHLGHPDADAHVTAPFDHTVLE